jgi:hypothetical protein
LVEEAPNHDSISGTRVDCASIEAAQMQNMKTRFCFIFNLFPMEDFY